MTGLVIDLFAGMGGVSAAIRDVFGRDPDVAINHNPTAIAVHALNHPDTLHLEGDVWHYSPRSVTQGRPVDLLHASPTCTFFSQAKGKPLDRKEASRVRALPWIAPRWAKYARPRIVTVENVSPFKNWGPLLNDGTPCPKRRGKTFRKWVRDFEKLGYVCDWRDLVAADYGAPTNRTRFFFVARCDGLPIAWPKPTHGPGTGQPYRGAHEIIDWTIPAPSIFGRKKPLVPATCERIARGIRRFVLETGEPWILSQYGTSTGHAVRSPLTTVTAGSTHQHLVVPFLIHLSNGERPTQEPRIYDIRQPLNTVVAGGVKQGLCFAFLAKNFGGHESPGQSLRSPLGAVTTRDHHALVVCSTIGDKREQVREFLRTYRGHAKARRQASLFDVLNDDGIVRIGGEEYALADIGARQLVPAELKAAHDLEGLIIDRDVHGNAIGVTAQTRLVGNSVPRRLAAAVIRANVEVTARRVA